MYASLNALDLPDLPVQPPAPFRLWVPKRVLVTPAALSWAHGEAMVQRAAALGAEVVKLPADRLAGLPAKYADAKGTLAVITASPSRRKLQPIPPSADWRFDLAEGCPAHCQYCYLAGSLSGPPITRAYANLPEILDGLASVVGQGTITSRQAARQAEGTTFEAGCYTDPLGIEHITGSLAAAVAHFGAWDAPVQLRFTTKFDGIGPLLDIAHHRRTRIRFSVNARGAERYEGGTARMSQRLAALRQVALAGYPVGLTVAPIIPVPDWQAGYDQLVADAAAAVADIPGLDLTAELITHRFTPGSKEVLQGWYPGSSLEMDEAQRSRKTTKFGSTKWVFTPDTMRELRAHLERSIADRLPMARVLYWT